MTKQTTIVVIGALRVKLKILSRTKLFLCIIYLITGLTSKIRNCKIRIDNKLFNISGL